MPSFGEQLWDALTVDARESVRQTVLAYDEVDPQCPARSVGTTGLDRDTVQCQRFVGHTGDHWAHGHWFKP